MKPKNLILLFIFGLFFFLLPNVVQAACPLSCHYIGYPFNECDWSQPYTQNGSERVGLIGDRPENLTELSNESSCSDGNGNKCKEGGFQNGTNGQTCIGKDGQWHLLGCNFTECDKFGVWDATYSQCVTCTNQRKIGLIGDTTCIMDVCNGQYSCGVPTNQSNCESACGAAAACDEVSFGGACDSNGDGTNDGKCKNSDGTADGCAQCVSTCKSNGTTCSVGTDCCSGICNDEGYCCNASCNGSCQTCTTGTCTTRSADDNTECSTCYRCNGSNTSCQAVTANEGKNCTGVCTYCSSGTCTNRTADDTTEGCATNCYDCVSGSCTAVTQDNDGTCNDDCTYCSSGSCTDRGAHDWTECTNTCYACTATVGSADNCQADTYTQGYNCLDPGKYCDAGTCCTDANNDNICDSVPAFDFSISTNPISGSVTQGSQVSTNVQITRTQGTSENVTFWTSNLPTGVTYNFSPTSCTPSDTCSSILTLLAASNAQLVTNWSVNVGGTATGGSSNFTTYGLTVTAAGAGINPPSVTTNSATNVTQTSATLNGTLNNMGNATSCLVWFKWGPTTAMENSTPVQTMTFTGSFSADISVLTSSTTYYFGAYAKNGGSW